MAKYWKLIVCALVLVALTACEKTPEVGGSYKNLTFVNNYDATAKMIIERYQSSFIVSAAAGSSKSTTLGLFCAKLCSKS